MILDTEVFVPVTDELQFAVRSQGDSYSPIFAVACERLDITYASMCPEVIYDGFVHVTKIPQAITQIFGQKNSGTNALFSVVDEDGSLLGWQVSVCYNEDDYEQDDDYDDED